MTKAADNIKKLRTQAGLTQEELAERLSVTRQTISSWETGRTEPDIAALESLASALDCSPGEIIGDAPENSGRGRKKYRSRALVFGCIAAALLIIYAIARPYLKEYASRTFRLWPGIIAYFTLKVPAFILGTLCVLSAVSAAWDVAVKNKKLRRTILALGIVLSILYVYACCAVFIGTISYPSCSLLGIRIGPFYQPALFAIPVCITYLGAVKPEPETKR